MPMLSGFNNYNYYILLKSLNQRLHACTVQGLYRVRTWRLIGWCRLILVSTESWFQIAYRAGCAFVAHMSVQIKIQD